MEDITTRNNIITDLEQYIKKSPFLNPKRKKREIWLHNLPKNEDLFNIIELLREEYNSEDFIFIINQKIETKKITINRNIDFSNCVFKYEVYFENDKKLLFDSTHFHKTIFNGNITFFNSKFYLTKFEDVDLQGDDYIVFAKCSLYKVEFHNVNFRGNIQFDQSEMKDVSFKNCTFKGKTDFSKASFKGKSEFLNCTFKGNTNFREVSFKEKSEFLNCTFDSSENNTTEKVNFSGCTFEQEANFSGSIFNLKANFSETIFGIKKEDNNSDESGSEVKFLIENAKFQKEVDFSKAIFYDAIYFSGTEFCTDIEDYAKKSINFENAQFKRKVRFHHCKFHNTVRFENTSFNKLVDFYCAHFYKPQQFHFTDFLDRAIFSNTEFDEEVQFLHCRVDSNSYIRFESATFKKSLDISRSNFNDKANFWNIELEEGDAFTSSKYQNDFNEKAKTESTKNTPTIYKKIRETYRIIKSNFYSQNNKIEGLKFYEKEMSVYLEEKRAEDKNPIKIIPLKKILYPIAKLSAIREKHNRIYDVIVIASNLIMYMFFVYEQSYTYFWILFLEAFIYVASLLYLKKKDIKNTIKQNNYISLIVLLASMFLLFIPIYNAIPKKDTDNDYICLFIEWMSSLLRSGYEYIIPYSLPFIAIFLIVSFLRREKLLLWFNKNSNEFGGNWVAGINFTIFVVLITYSFILLPISCNLKFSLTSAGISNFLKSLVDILNLTDWNEMTIFGEKLTNWQYIFLFIGRIFVAYGVYQTVQAFRKFGKS